MMSKKEFQEREMGTLKRSRTPTVVLTVNGEVHTHEEARQNINNLGSTFRIIMDGKKGPEPQL